MIAAQSATAATTNRATSTERHQVSPRRATAGGSDRIHRHAASTWRIERRRGRRRCRSRRSAMAIRSSPRHLLGDAGPSVGLAHAALRHESLDGDLDRRVDDDERRHARRAADRSAAGCRARPRGRCRPRRRCAGAISARTAGWTMRVEVGERTRRRRTRSRRAPARSSAPSARMMPAPKRSASTSSSGAPGACSSRTIASASMITAPRVGEHRRHRRLAGPMPPVRATRITVTVDSRRCGHSAGRLAVPTSAPVARLGRASAPASAAGGALGGDALALGDGAALGASSRRRAPSSP